MTLFGTTNHKQRAKGLGYSVHPRTTSTIEIDLLRPSLGIYFIGIDISQIVDYFIETLINIIYRSYAFHVVKMSLGLFAIDACIIIGTQISGEY